ncbi:hypothetical protein IKJ53_05980, partial [bacterium]|nr:hypothetical protein [bacterium]
SNNGSFTLNDVISGSSGYNIIINADNNKFVINNSIENADITVNNGVITLIDYTRGDNSLLVSPSQDNMSDWSSNILASSNLEVVNGVINVDDDIVTNYVINNLTSSPYAQYKIDVDGDNKVADSFSVGIGSTGTITLYDIGDVNSYAVRTDISTIIKVLFRADNNVDENGNYSINLALSQDLIDNSKRYYDIIHYGDNATDAIIDTSRKATKYTIYENSFLGETGVSINDAKDSLVIGAIVRKSQLYEMNMFSTTLLREFRFSSDANIVVAENLGYEATSSGIFHIIAQSRDNNIIELLNADSVKNNGFMPKDTEFVVSDVTIRNGKYAVKTNNARAKITLNNVKLSNNDVALDLSAGETLLDNVLVESPQTPDSNYILNTNSSVLTVKDSTVSSGSYIANTGKVVTTGDSNTIDALYTAGEVVLGSANDDIETVINTGSVEVTGTVNITTLKNNYALGHNTGVVSDPAISDNAKFETVAGSSSNITTLENRGLVALGGTDAVATVDNYGKFNTAGVTTITSFNNNANAVANFAGVLGGSATFADSITTLVNNGEFSSSSASLFVDSFTNNAISTILSNATISNLINSGNVAISGGALEITTLTNNAGAFLTSESTDSHIVNLTNASGATVELGADDYVENLTNAGSVTTDNATAIDSLTNTGSIISAGNTVLGREGLTTNDSIINKGSISVSGDVVINGDVSTNNDNNATSNSFEISGNAKLTGSIHSDQNLALTDSSVVEVVGDGLLNLNSGDVWSGEVTLTNGIINYVDLSSNGNLYAVDGVINVLDSNVASTVLNLINDSQIAEDVEINIANNATINVLTGTLNINDNDSWNGTILLGTGVVNYNGSLSTGVIKTTAGELNILNDNTLTIKTGSDVKADTLVNITENSTLALTGGQVSLDNSDSWGGMITATSGKLILTGDSAQQFVVKPDVLKIDSADVITNFATTGYNSNVDFETTDVMLALGNDKLDNFVIGNIKTVGPTEMTIDVDLENRLIDTIYAGNASNGIVKITDFNTFADVLEEVTLRVLYTTSNDLTLDVSDEIAVTDVRLIGASVVNQYLVQEKGLELAKSDDSLSYYDSLTVYSEVVYDTLRILNQLVTNEDRNFIFELDNNSYEVFENLGVTTAGKLNIQGVSSLSGNNIVRSSLDLTGDDPNYAGVNKVSHTGFELANQTILNVFNVDFKDTNNANSDLIKVSNDNAVINLYNSVINGNIVGTNGSTAVINVSNDFVDVANPVDAPYTILNGRLDNAVLNLNGGSISFNTDTFASNTTKFVANKGHVDLVD